MPKIRHGDASDMECRTRSSYSQRLVHPDTPATENHWAHTVLSDQWLKEVGQEVREGPECP